MSDARKLTSAEARALLRVEEPQKVAFTNSKGKHFDDDGNHIDKREAVPHVYALGPFGSWPTTLEDAEKEFAKHDEWFYGKSFRLGHVVIWDTGWGFAAKPIDGGTA